MIEWPVALILVFLALGVWGANQWNREQDKRIKRLMIEVAEMRMRLYRVEVNAKRGANR
jgi:hypothetical protein